jgi:hypothetical protein
VKYHQGEYLVFSFGQCEVIKVTPTDYVIRWDFHVNNTSVRRAILERAAPTVYPSIEFYKAKSL